METAQIIATSHRAALDRQMKVIANNLANMNTTGYRGERMIFQEYMQETGDNKHGGLSFVEDTTTFRRSQEGPMQKTGNPFDVAIRGEGFFAVQTENGERYTRAGNFHLNAENQLVTNRGHQVLDAQGDPIAIPGDEGAIQIMEDGTIRSQEGEIAQLDVVTFDQPNALTRHAAGLYEAGEQQQPKAAEDAVVEQGMLEGSNVQGIKEMTHMMEIMRNQQSAAKLAKKDHEMMLRAIRTITGGGG